MKRTTLAVLLASLLSTTAFASGYTGPGTAPKVSTVAEAQAATDDTDVVLEGVIIERLGNERYKFQDGTGIIVVEIDEEDWPTQEISETTQVRLIGEVDKDANGVEIDVDTIELIQ